VMTAAIVSHERNFCRRGTAFSAAIGHRLPKNRGLQSAS
jgi:hypothetical protein